MTQMQLYEMLAESGAAGDMAEWESLSKKDRSAALWSWRVRRHKAKHG